MSPHDLWLFMEEIYRKRGASVNGAQLIIRSNRLNKMVERYGAEQVRWMLEHDFNKYHFGEVK